MASRAVLLVGLLASAGVTPACAAQYSIIHNFQGGTDGRLPNSPPAADGSGRLYVEAIGGLYGYGAVFRLTPPSSPGAEWSEADIFDFGSARYGLFCGVGPLTVDESDNIYGTGSPECGDTSPLFTVYRLSPTGETYDFIDLFKSATRQPYTGVQFGADGLLYGGGGDTIDHLGLLFRVSPVPGPSRVSAVANGRPGDLSISAKGRFFFATQTGGSNGLGTVEMLTTRADGHTQLSTIYSFQSGTDANSPSGYAPAIGSDHDVYGCGYGGANGLGAIYQLTRPSAGQTNWTETVIYSFTSADTLEAGVCGLAAGAHGTLVGVLSNGGRDFQGILFGLTPPSTPSGVWTYSVLHAFNPRAGDLSNAGAPVRVGNSYFGTASGGGTAGMGGIYEIVP